MKILIIGDIVGKGAQRAVQKLLPDLRREHGCCFCIANGENVADGSGLTEQSVNELLQCGVDVITTGDHVWGKKDFLHKITRFPRVLRPANFSSAQPGRGYDVFNIPAGGSIGVINLVGRVFLQHQGDNPFVRVDGIVDELKRRTNIIFVDFHAEATSEKVAMGHHLDGRVTTVFGTHTHVPTADECILPGGTAYISDVGMVGGRVSIIGRDITAVVRTFLTGIPSRYKVVDTDIVLNGAVVEYNSANGRAIRIERISRNV